MLRKSLLGIGCLLLAASAASAGVICYVTVDTSSLASTNGAIDFNFDPGPLVTQAASVDIVGFSSDGTPGTASTIGDVTGVLPSTVTINNTNALNDYFTDFSFGNTLSFRVDFYGPAVDSPDGVSTSGSSFAFSMFSDAAGTVPVLTTDSLNGYALTVDLNPDGTTALTKYSNETTADLVTPEPFTLPLVGAPLILLATWWNRRARIGRRR
jgi:hypothetical protein